MNRFDQSQRSILFIVPSDYGSLVNKGVSHLILERDEGGFFDKVITVHPHASKTQRLILNERHRLVEFGPSYPFPFLNFKFGRVANFLLRPMYMINAINRLVLRERIDVIRATDPYECGFYAWAASRFTAVPFCVSIHADDEKCYRLAGIKEGVPSLCRMLESFILPRAQMVMPIREYLVQKVLGKGIDPSKVRVIPHGVRVDQFQHRELENISQIYGMSSEKKLISFVGRLAKENYVDDMIELAKRLSKNRDDFVLLLIGDGPERGRLEELVKEYNLSSVVHFTGFQSFGRVISIRQQSFLALCLMGGLSLIEACAAGCPVISYNVEWHSELVRNGETGFLIEERNLDSLLETALFLLDHPSEARSMGERARELAISRHDLSRTSEIKRECYKELMEPRSQKTKIEKKKIEQKQKDPALELMKDNPWYVSSQMAASQENYRRTIQQRYRFILESIGKYSKLNSSREVRILDAGCGDGVQLEMLTKIPRVKVWGADYNPLRVKRAKRTFVTAHLICCNLLHLPFRSASFDIVLCSQVIEHIPQDNLLLTKLADLLRPTGLLILGTPNEGCLMARLRNHLLERKILKSTDHLHYYTENSIRRKIESSGFTVERVLRENWFIPNQRLSAYLANCNWGFGFMMWLNRVIPSHAAGYYFECIKDMSRT